MSTLNVNSIQTVGGASPVLTADIAKNSELIASSGSSLVGHIAAGTGAVATTVQSKLRESVSVLDFGAHPSAVAAVNTGAIQACIDWCKANNIRGIDFEGGNYNTNATLNIFGDFGDGLYLKGVKTTITCSANAPVIELNGALPSPAPEYRMNHVINGINLVGSGLANTSSVALQITNGANVTIRDCILKNAYKAFYGNGALIIDFDGVIFRDCYYGIDAINTVSFAPNAFNLVNCKIIVNTKALRVQNFDYGAWNFFGCEIEGNNLAGGIADGVRVCEFVVAGEVNFYGCHFESNPGQYNLYYSGDRHINFYGCRLIPGDTCAYVIYVTGTGYLTVDGSTVVTNTGNNIYIDVNAGALLIGDTSGSLAGTVRNVTRITKSGIKIGSAGYSGQLGDYYSYAPANNTVIESLASNALWRFENLSGTRIAEIGVAAAGVGTLWQYQNYGWEFGANNAYRMLIGRSGAASVESGIDNGITLGSAALRWSTVYAGTGTINTSDARTKQQIRTVSDAEHAVAVRLKGLLRAFKFNDAVIQKGDSARIHFGVVAQDVKAAFEAEGLIAESYALLCYDTWEDITVDVKNDNGDPTGEVSVLTPAGDRYGVRYEELLAFIISTL